MKSILNYLSESKDSIENAKKYGDLSGTILWLRKELTNPALSDEKKQELQKKLDQVTKERSLINQG